MFALSIAALVAATLSTGLVAGVFYAYANSVMLALRQSDDRTMIDVMQKINVVILNPWFMFSFLGSVGFTVLAVALHLGKDARTTLIWLAVALVINVIAFAVAAGLNVPLNNALEAAGDPAQIADLAAVRADFESPWIRWNILRGVLHTAAFLVLCGALFVAGQQHGKSESEALPAGAVAGGGVAQPGYGGPVQPGHGPARW
ncbi:anthrone oxygenase family protein [Nocardia crassostreae]|uniref:anthrone oxygenase family protein n=1 Tax=Nocardia crassostreae TaxID=53428 RepID=UPI0008310065|nr:anthrone oxygenase family protein [Nocardia crassostreae]